MTSTKGKLRSLFLTALMVTSVFAGSIVLTGSAAAAANDRGDGGGYSLEGSNGTVGPNATIFQGEEDISIVDKNNNSLSPTDFERTSGSNEGETLEIPVPEDQPTGSYSTDITSSSSGYDLTVRTPRVQTLEVQTNGEDISGGSVNVDESTTLTIDAVYNFDQVEPLDLTIEDESGLDVTGTVLENFDDGTFTPSSSAVSDGELTVTLDNSELDNEEYTVTAEGDEDLDFGDASRSTTFSVTTGDNVEVDVVPEEVTRGENARFEIDNANEGDTHVVSIDADDVERTASSVFRNAGDTLATAGVNDNALALVEIEDGVGLGSIDTSQLDTSDVTVDVYNASIANNSNELQGITAQQLDTFTSVDDDDFTVNEGGVQLDNPQGAYVAGSEVTVNGTTTPGVDTVALYARDEDDFEFLMNISVDGDDTFEEEDVVLSNPDAGDVMNDTLSIPGSYRIAAVDADDSALKANVRADQNTSAISEAIGSQSSLRVTDTSLTVDYVSIINGQVATDDDLTINGTAPGQERVTVSFYGPRGTYDRTTLNVDSDSVFESENVQVGENLESQITPDTDLSQGNVVMSVYSSGRDGSVGDGQLDGYGRADSLANLQSFWTDLNTGSNTQQQVIDQVASETVEDTGSDDLSEVFQFRYTDGRVSVDSVTGEAGQAFTVETNDTMTVSGVTNRQPDDNTITVEVIEGPSSSGFDIESTDTWGTDGQWSIDVPTEGVEPGNYTVEATVGGNSDIRSFEVTSEDLEPSEPSEPGNETDTPDDTPSEPVDTTEEPVDTTEEPVDTTEEPVDTTEEQEPADTEEQTTTEGGPGFTAVLALVALVAAALLAVRRRD